MALREGASCYNHNTFYIASGIWSVKISFTNMNILSMALHFHLMKDMAKIGLKGSVEKRKI